MALPSAHTPRPGTDGMAWHAGMPQKGASHSMGRGTSARSPPGKRGDRM